MITLDAFIEKTHAEVDAFKAYYLKERAKAEDKTDWPLKFDEGDWYEQFIAWQDMGQPTGDEE